MLKIIFNKMSITSTSLPIDNFKTAALNEKLFEKEEENKGPIIRYFNRLSDNVNIISILIIAGAFALGGTAFYLHGKLGSDEKNSVAGLMAISVILFIILLGYTLIGLFYTKLHTGAWAKFAVFIRVIPFIIFTILLIVIYALLDSKDRDKKGVQGSFYTAIAIAILMGVFLYFRYTPLLKEKVQEELNTDLSFPTTSFSFTSPNLKYFKKLEKDNIKLRENIKKNKCVPIS